MIQHQYVIVIFTQFITNLDLRLGGHGLETRQLKIAWSRGSAMASSPHATLVVVCLLVMQHPSLVLILATQWLRLILLAIQLCAQFLELSSELKNLVFLWLQLHKDLIQLLAIDTEHFFHKLDHRLKVTHIKWPIFPNNVPS